MLLAHQAVACWLTSNLDPFFHSIILCCGCGKPIGRMHFRSEAEYGSARGGVLNHPLVLIASVAVLAQALITVSQPGARSPDR